MPTVSGQVVLVTGATSGIGKSVSELLASLGAKVVLSGRRKEQGELVAAEIVKSGGDAIFIEADISSEKGVTDLVSAAVKHYGRLDGAVNNAGIATDDKIFHELSTEKFQDMLQTNVMGVFWCMKAQIAAMLENQSGSIVNLASMAGLNGIPYSGSYVATKHAVVGMTKTAAVEYGTKGIRVNAVAPGAIRTDILDYAIKSGSYPVEKIEGMFPMRKMGAPIDIAEAIVFLLQSAYSTGTILSVDGGFSAA